MNERHGSLHRNVVIDKKEWSYTCRTVTVSITCASVKPQVASLVYRVAQKSKPLPSDQKIVLNRIKASHWD